MYICVKLIYRDPSVSFLFRYSTISETVIQKMCLYNCTKFQIDIDMNNEIISCLNK